MEQKFDLRTRTLFYAVNTRRQNFGIVNNQHVAGFKVVDYIVKMLMFDFARFAIVNQHSAVIARLDRRLSDKFFG